MLRLRLRLKELREERGIKQQELAIQADMRQATLSAMESNEGKMINIANLERIINELHITDPKELFYILDEEDIKEYVNAAEFAKMLGVSRQYVHRTALECISLNYTGDFLNPDEWDKDMKNPKWLRDRANEYAQSYKKRK